MYDVAAVVFLHKREQESNLRRHLFVGGIQRIYKPAHCDVDIPSGTYFRPLLGVSSHILMDFL